MEFSEDDIKRYVTQFPGDCVLYSVHDLALTQRASTPGINRLFGQSYETYVRSRMHDPFAEIISCDQPAVKNTLAQGIAQGDGGMYELYVRIHHETRNFRWVHLRGKTLGTYLRDPLIVVEFLPTDIENETIDRLVGDETRISYMADEDTFELIYANTAALTLWGKDDYAGRKCYEFIKGLDAPCPECSFFKMSDDLNRFTERCYDDEFDCWFEIDCRRAELFGHRAFTVFATDITEDVRNSLRAREDDEIIHLLTDSVFEFIAIIDVRTRTISFREIGEAVPSGRPTTGIDYDTEFLDAIEGALVPEEREDCRENASLDVVIEELSKASSYSYDGTQSGSEQGETYRKKLEYRWLNDSHEKIILLRSDITEAFKNEQNHVAALRDAVHEADLANSAKTDFLSRVSHDMRTPLNGILGLAKIMRDETSLDEIFNDLEKLEFSGKYLLRLINDTLDVSKIEAGEMKLTPEVCNGRIVLENVENLLRPLIDEKHQTFIVDETDEQDEELFIDVGRIEQLIMNIAGNAVKFTPDGGTITLRSRKLEDTPRYFVEEISIQDTGVGMSPEFIPHVFEPFAQEDRTSTTTHEGTGLGLTVAKRIVELMDGTISVTSEVGKGTTFTFTLRMDKATPQQIAAAAPSEDAAAETVDLNGTKILLCEDHPINAEIASRLLAKVGCVVEVAHDGVEGVELVEKGMHTYDAVLMDVRMPKMDGLDATRAIRKLPDERAATIPIIAMTANAFEDDIRMCREAGMNDHIAKPVDPDKLYERVATAIAEERKNAHHGVTA